MGCLGVKIQSKHMLPPLFLVSFVTFRLYWDNITIWESFKHEALWMNQYPKWTFWSHLTIPFFHLKVQKSIVWFNQGEMDSLKKRKWCYLAILKVHIFSVNKTFRGILRSKDHQTTCYSHIFGKFCPISYLPG